MNKQAKTSLGEMCHTQDFCIGIFSLRCLGFNLVKNKIIKLKGPVWWRRWQVSGGGLPQMFLRNLCFNVG